MKSIYIISSNCRAANYGIGSYVGELVKALNGSDFKVNIINLFSPGSGESHIEYTDGIRYINISSPKSEDVNDLKNSTRYYKNSYYYLLNYINENDEIIFHFNFMQAEELALRLKKKFKCKILLTVHYMEWSFSLLGDRTKLYDIINKHPKIGEEYVINSLQREKNFIDKCTDHIIAIANHSFETLSSIYEIPSSKMSIIANGIQDDFILKDKHDRVKLRKFYGFKENEILLIFAGRLDEIKGVGHLLKIFNHVLINNENVRLLIIGDGAFNKFFDDSYPNWSKIIYTGFIDKIKLNDLYYISDIGIVPSLHEEFGYVAIEMMMNNLALIVNNTTGLSEIVKNNVNGYSVLINKNIDQLELSIGLISEKITMLINDKYLRDKFAGNGRKIFLSKYNSDLFKYKMINLYQNLLCKNSII